MSGKPVLTSLQSITISDDHSVESRSPETPETTASEGSTPEPKEITWWERLEIDKETLDLWDDLLDSTADFNTEQDRAVPDKRYLHQIHQACWNHTSSLLTHGDRESLKTIIINDPSLSVTAYKYCLIFCEEFMKHIEGKELSEGQKSFLEFSKELIPLLNDKLKLLKPDSPDLIRGFELVHKTERLLEKTLVDQLRHKDQKARLPAKQKEEEKSEIFSEKIARSAEVLAGREERLAALLKAYPSAGVGSGSSPG